MRAKAAGLQALGMYQVRPLQCIRGRGRLRNNRIVAELTHIARIAPPRIEDEDDDEDEYDYEHQDALRALYACSRRG